MLRWLRELSDRGEFLLVNGLCFGWFIFGALWMALEPRELLLTNGRVAEILGFELLAGALAIAILRVRGWRLRRLGIEPSWPLTFAGVLLFLVYLLSWRVLLNALCTIPGVAELLGATPRMHHTAAWPLLLILAIVNPIYEETFVAAYTIQATSRIGPTFAMTTSILLRVSYHLYQGPSAFLSIGFFGLIAASVYWRWRKAWPLIVTHAILDGLAFAFHQ